MRRTDRTTITQGIIVFAAMIGLSIGCSQQDPTAPGKNEVVQTAATVAQLAATITGQEAPLADESKAGKNLGFDTHTFPGEKTMRAWKNAPGAPYSWVGYYLPSPCHKDGSWVGKRQLLQSMGWGLAVVYVGQQTWGRKPKTLSADQIAQLIRTGSTCNADLLGTIRGAADGADAIAVTEREG